MSFKEIEPRCEKRISHRDISTETQSLTPPYRPMSNYTSTILLLNEPKTAFYNVDNAFTAIAL